MPIFETSTPVVESPDTGHEDAAAEEQYETEQDTQDLQVEAEQDVAEEENEESPSQEEHGELLAGKYKSVDDLVKAYKNLEREFHKGRQQPQPQPQYEEQAVDPTQVFWDSFQQNPFGTIEYLVEQRLQQSVAPLYEERANSVLSQNLSELSKEYQEVGSEEGLSKLFATVNEIAQELGNPNIAQNPSPRILKMAASEAFGDSKAKIYAQAKAKGKQEALNNIKAKQGLSAPVGAKPKDQSKTPADLIRESIRNAGGKGGVFTG